MEPLATTQKVGKLCFLFTDKDNGIYKKIFSIFLTATIFLAEVCGFAGALVFFLKYVSIDLEMSLSGLFPLIGHFTGFYSIIFVLFSRYQIKYLFKRLSTIYEISKEQGSLSILLRADLLSEKLWNFYIKYVLLGCLTSNISFSLITTLFCYYKHGHFQAESVFHTQEIL